MSFDPEPFVEHCRDENAREEGLIAERARLALAEAKRLALAIKASDPGITGVILFGSLAQGRPARLDSSDHGSLLRELGWPSVAAPR